MLNRRNFLKSALATLVGTPVLAKGPLEEEMRTKPKKKPSSRNEFFDPDRYTDRKDAEWVYVKKTDEKAFHETKDTYTLQELTGNPKGLMRLKADGGLYYIEHGIGGENIIGNRVTTLELKIPGKINNNPKSPKLSYEFRHGSEKNGWPFFHEKFIRFAKEGDKRFMMVYDLHDNRIHLFMKKE
jgi:hypothetical protein